MVKKKSKDLANPFKKTYDLKKHLIPAKKINFKSEFFNKSVYKFELIDKKLKYNR